MTVELCLRNPLLDVFEKYMQPTDHGLYRWEARTGGYAGAPRHDRQNAWVWRRHMSAMENAWTAKWALREHMAFAVPNTEAIKAIAELNKPVVEIGAGTGYWAWLLEQAGVDVIAYDIAPDESNHYCASDHWTAVRKGGASMALKHADRALMLCWPPYSEPMAAACMYQYHGDTLIYIGEHHGGCCADEQFFNLLDGGWNVEREVEIPQWEGLHDSMTIYRRRKSR